MTNAPGTNVYLHFDLHVDSDCDSRALDLSALVLSDS
jgi:hypothetical protein